MKFYKHSLGWCCQLGRPYWRLQVIIGIPRRYSYGESWYSPLTIRYRYR